MNSEQTTSPNSTPSLMNAQSADSPLPLDAQTAAVLSSEAPNLTNNPTGKPLRDMTQEELSEWHARLTAHLQSPQTLLAHVKAPSVKKQSEPREPARDISKYE